MIEQSMPQDILKYKSKFIANFSLREMGCASVGIGLGLLCYFSWAKNVPSQDFRMFLSFLTIMPFLLVGFVKIYGLPFEQIVPVIIIDNFLSPPKKKKEIHYPEFEKYEKIRYWQVAELEKIEEENKKAPGKKKQHLKPIKIAPSAQYIGIK